MPAAAAKRTLFFERRNGGVVDASLVSVDNAGLRMRRTGGSFAE
jgi:hypothetical protein